MGQQVLLLLLAEQDSLMSPLCIALPFAAPHILVGYKTHHACLKIIIN